ncbi:MAG: hypothetical protein ACRCXZ_10020 [Patescibacteria group bacterium]
MKSVLVSVLVFATIAPCTLLATNNPANAELLPKVTLNGTEANSCSYLKKGEKGLNMPTRVSMNGKSKPAARLTSGKYMVNMFTTRDGRKYYCLTKASK